jgi:hypothetical protein
MTVVQMGGLVVLAVIAIDIALGYALARWNIDP